MNRAEAWFSAIFLLAGIVYEITAARMPLGKLAYPGPGYFPMIVGGFLILTAAACLIQALLPSRAGAGKPAPEAAEASSARPLWKTWTLVGCLAAYVLALQPVGFPIAITVFLVASIWTFGYRKWLPALLIALGLAFISYVTFVVWLKVPLPLGILTDLLD